MLTFEPVQHEYRWNGEVVPSVTTVLKPFYNWDRVEPEVLERKRQIGTATHAAIMLEYRGQLDESTIDPVVEPFIKAWHRFRIEMGVLWQQVESCEEPLYHPRLRYAGTPDLIMMLNGTLVVLDIKTALALSPVWGLQTAGYMEMINAHARSCRVTKRFSLRLNADGTYKLHEHRNASDLTVFTSALNVWHWARSNL